MGETTAQRFGRIVGEAARKAGYDLDSPRGGGKVALARDTGMTKSSVGRMLAGETLPDARFYEPLANAVRLPVRTLLIESGIISAKALTDSSHTHVASRHTTPEQVAEEWFDDPGDRDLFLAMVERMRRRPPAGTAHDPRHGGAAAEQ